MSSSSAPTGVVGELLAERYAVVRLIARGGMGEVYEAHDTVLGRAVAVKLYRSTVLADRSRFDEEVRILAGLSHPGLVQIYDAGEHGDDEFVVLELVDGPTLASLLEDRGALPVNDVRALGLAVGDALAYVHASGVVHRDVTPSNILCGRDGRTRLADFGIARLLDTTRLTGVDLTVGTVGYMAPEQVDSSDVTSSADIYSLALILLEALTGLRAFPGSGHQVALARLARDPDVTTGVPQAWRPLLRAMTGRVPETRPPAGEVVARLGRLRPSAIVTRGPSEVVTGDLDASVAPTQVMPRPAAMPPSETPTGAAEVVPTDVLARHDGTTVMPATQLPAASPVHGFWQWWAGRARPWVWVAAVLVVIAAVAMTYDRPMAVDVPPSTAEVSVTAPPTTAAPAPPSTTVAPRPKEPKHKGHGKD